MPGVYTDVGEAQAQCRGVSGAVMQRFSSRAEAAAFAAAPAPPAAGARGGGGGNFRYYAVRVGVKPGVYSSNAEAQAQVVRVPGALYRGYNSLAEAEEYVRGGRSVPAAPQGKKRPRPSGY